MISGNQFVSTAHCVLGRGEGGELWIQDTSTNGTLLNGARLERNKEVWSLHHTGSGCLTECVRYLHCR